MGAATSTSSKEKLLFPLLGDGDDSITQIIEEDDDVTVQKQQHQYADTSQSINNSSDLITRSTKLYAFCAALNSCNLGYDIGVNTGAGMLLQESLDLSDVQLEVFMGSLNLFAMVGALSSHWISDKFGRKASFRVSAVIFILRIIIQSSAYNYTALMFGRTFVGLGVGFGLAFKADVNTIPNCLAKNPNRTYMETYNCEPTTHPKPKSWAWRAKKQIYRPDFVLNHFVHYSVVTRQIIDRPELESLRFIERQPYERRVNEISEGYLLHSKSTLPEMTKDWNSKCPLKGESDGSTKSCKVGIPSTNLLGIKNVPKQLLQSTESEDLISSNFEPNCYPHFRVKGIVPLLEEAIRRIKSKSRSDLL